MATFWRYFATINLKKSSNLVTLHASILTDVPHIDVHEPWVHAGIRTSISLRCRICAEKPFSVSHTDAVTVTQMPSQSHRWRHSHTDDVTLTVYRYLAFSNVVNVQLYYVKPGLVDQGWGVDPRVRTNSVNGRPPDLSHLEGEEREGEGLWPLRLQRLLQQDV